MADIEVEHFEREIGKSNYNFSRSLKHFMSCLNYTALPLRFATFFGMLFSFTGFIGAIVVFIQKICRPDIAVGWTSLMCGMLIFFGITFLLLGIIGEYIGKLILNINRTPQFVVRETVNADTDSDRKDI